MECTTVREPMLEVLYGEASPETAGRVEEHLAVCPVCRDELAALRRLRAELRGYTLPALPAPQLGRRPARWGVGLAAAATLLLALGAGVAHARISALERRLEAQQADHQREVAALRASLGTTAPAANAADAALLPRVEELVRASEERQAERLDASLREFSERTQTQRRYDLARVSAGLSYLDGRSGQHAARTAELMGYVLQAAEKK